MSTDVNPKTPIYSKCCLSSVRLYSGEEGTNHYICNACDEACDITTSQTSTPTDVNGLEEPQEAIRFIVKHIWDKRSLADSLGGERYFAEKDGEFAYAEKFIADIIKAEQNKLLDRVLEQKQFIACLDTNEDHNVVPVEAIKTLREGL